MSTIPAVSHASILLHEILPPTPQAYAHFGQGLGGGGDVNGDHYDDIVVGAPDFDLGGGLENAGEAYVFSGKTGTPLWSCTSPNPEGGAHFGLGVTIIRDLNADGFDDVVVGAPDEGLESGPADAGRVYVFCGRTGVLLMTIVSPDPEVSGKFGHSVAAPGDMDLDGVDDILVGATGETSDGGLVPAGLVYAMSGVTGSHLLTFVSPNEEANGCFGHAIAGAGHTNADAYPDVIVGAPFENNPGYPESTGRAYLFDGHTAAVRFSFQGYNTSEDDNFGWSVAGGDDSDGDGYDDMVIGAPGQDHPAFQYVDTGWIYRFSGLTGQSRFVDLELFEQAYGYCGESVACIGDWDRDGFDDIAFGLPGPGETALSGAVEIISGAAGTSIDWAEPPVPESWGLFGMVLAAVGDVNDDWYPDFAVTSLYANVVYEDTGRVWVIGRPHPTISLSAQVSSTHFVLLTWNAVYGATQYWIYGAVNDPYFEPQSEGPSNNLVAVTSGTAWISLAPTGNEDANWTYLVAAMNSAGVSLCKSNRAGEFDREVLAP